MNHFFITPNQINDKKITVIGNDVRHIKDVLRMKVGDEATFSDGVNPVEYHGIITELGNEMISFDLCYIEKTSHELPARVYLFQGLPKADKMELVIQKAVELGVHEIIPISTNRSIVKLDAKKASAKTKRWNSISEAAAKQCKRGIVPIIREVKSFDEAVKYASEMEIKIIPYEMADDVSATKEIINNIKPEQEIAIFIGPEGGFSDTEIRLAQENGFIPITMGKRILRTETAAFVILSWIMYHLEG